MEPLRRRGALAVVVAVLALLAVHLLLARHTPGPVLYDDGAAYLAQARYLSGHPNPPDLTHTAFYQPGYPLVLVPAHLLGSDPASQHRLALGTNAVLAVVLVLPLYRLARGPLGLPGARAAIAAVVTATYPPVLLQSGFEWAESLLMLGFALWALALHHLLRRPAAPASALAGAAAGGLYLVHQRAVIAGVVAAAVLVGLVLRGRLAWRGAAAGLGALGLVLAGTRALGSHLRSALWSQAQPTLEGDVIATALDPGAWPTVAVHAAGQAWYLAVASLGLAVVGGVVLVRLVTGRPDDPTGAAWAARWWAAAVLGGVALTLALSAVFTVRGERVDHLVYGRYNDALVPLLLLAALALVLRPGRAPRALVAPAATAVLTVVATAGTLRLVRGVDAFTGHVMPLNVAGLLPLHRNHGVIPTGRLSLLAVGLAVGVLLASALAPRVGTAVLAVVFVTGAFVGEARTVRPFVEFWSGIVSIQDDVAARTAPGDTVGVDWQSFNLVAFNAYQLRLDDRRLAIFDSDREPPPARLVIAAPDWPHARALGGRLLAEDPYPVGLGLWELGLAAPR